MSMRGKGGWLSTKNCDGGRGTSLIIRGQHSASQAYLRKTGEFISFRKGEENKNQTKRTIDEEVGVLFKISVIHQHMVKTRKRKLINLE